MTKSMDMINGGLFKKIVVFTLPIMFQALLQTLYNSADTIIVGRFANDGGVALAAVGATVTVYGTLVGFFLGIATGVDVIASLRHGMGDQKGLKETIDTSVIVSPIIGVIVMIIGMFAARHVLALMNTPEADGVLDAATRYMQIVMIGVPFLMIYNFIAAVLRTGGETKRPFIYLAISGLVNLILNIVFVAGFGLAEVGVALATVISQILSAVLIFILLVRNKNEFSFSIKNISFSFQKLKNVLSVGILAGIQSAMFNISNAFLQSGVNTFGKDAMAGSSATATIEGLLYYTSTAPLNAATTFVSQNVGAKKLDRVHKITLYVVAISAILGLVLGLGGFFLRYRLVGLFTDIPEAIQYGAERAFITFPIYFLAAIMGTLPGVIRGLGYSLPSTLISLIGACGIRIVWIYTIFKINPTMTTLYLVHPVTWVITIISFVICYIICFRLTKKRIQT